MKVKEKKQRLFTIELNEEELITLVGDLENAKADWSTMALTDNILKELKDLITGKGVK